MIPELCVEEYILDFFKELSTQKKMISQLDPTLARFSQLKVLNLSFNNIKRIEFLPPNLQELFLNGNEIDEVGINVNKPVNSLIHLGLSLNKIR
mgnify:CR=1 FL=1